MTDKTAPKFVNPNTFNVMIPRKRPERGSIVLAPWGDRNRGLCNATFVVEGEYFEQFAATGQLAPFPGDENTEVPAQHEGNVPATPAVNTGGSESGAPEPDPVNEALVEAVTEAFSEDDNPFDPTSEEPEVVNILTAAHEMLVGQEVTVEIDPADAELLEDVVSDFKESQDEQTGDPDGTEQTGEGGQEGEGDDPQTEEEQSDGLDEMNVTDLKEYAKQNEINLRGATRKDDIKDAIRAAQAADKE